MNKQTIFSGIQPSGVITLGNLIGAIKNWVKMQEDNNCVYSIVDLHAITVPQEPEKLKENTLRLLSLYLASGINPDKCVIFLQSHVSAHAELTWILNTITYPGELSRMTQYKDKSRKKEIVNMGLMDYPVLQAADILLYDAHLVPIGADQKQHLELSRDLAIRFNNRFGETFVVPQPVFPKIGAKIMSLTEPAKKMSKSDANPNAYISLTDSDDLIMKKFKSAVTDSDNKIMFAKDKPGISNLLSIYGAVKGITTAKAESEFAGSGYGQLKVKTGEAVVEIIKPIRELSDRYMKDKDYLIKVLKKGAEKANKKANEVLSRVYGKIGLLEI